MKLAKHLGLITILVLIFSLAAYSQDKAKSLKEQNTKDIATFGTMSLSKDVKDDLLVEIDNQVVSAIEELKRFKIQGLQNYRWETENIEEFIGKIQEYRYEKGKTQTADQKFAGISITGEEFDKLMQAFLVAVPVITSYTETYYDNKPKSNKSKDMTKGCEISYELKLRFIDVSGKKDLDPIKLKMSGSASKISDGKITDEEKKELYGKAKADAVGGMAGTLTMKIRQHPFFMLKGKIVEIKGTDATIELGVKDISPGDEFLVQVTEKTKSGHEKKVDIGYIRIFKVHDEISEGTILWGDVKEGDPVLENALFGVFIDIRFGMAVWNRDANFKRFAGIKENESGKAIKQDYLLPAVTLSFGYELLYALKLELDLTRIIPLEGKLYSMLGEFGIRYTYYIGGTHLSMDFGAFGTIAAVIGNFELKSAVNGVALDNGTTADFNEGVNGNMSGIGYGGKAEVNINYQFNPYFKLVAGGGFRYTTKIKKDQFKVSVDGKTLADDGKEQVLKQLVDTSADNVETDFIGPFFNLGIQGRF